MQEQEVIIDQQQAEFVNQKPVPKAQEIEFLEKYEIKNWEFSPRLYKILAASAVFNILALFVFAQTNILQARACDSPWVNRVCQVLDTVYLGSTILNTNSEFVSKPYEKTELEDAEIVWINQTGTEPLNYPGGYFALANPETQFTAMQDPTLMNPDMQGFQNFTPPSTNFPTQTPMPVTPSPNFNLPPQKLPPPAKNQVTIPDNIIGENPIGNNTRKGKNTKPENKKPDEDATAKNENKDDKQPESKQPGINSQPVMDFRPNKDPLRKFAKGVVIKRASQKGTLELDKPFLVELSGTLTEDGKFDEKKTGYIKSEGDEDMINLAKDAIEAIGDSQLFYYLKNLGVDKVNFKIYQDDKQLYAVITSSQNNEARARTISSGFNGLILLAQGTVKEEELQTLLKAMEYKAEGKNFVLDFKIDKPIAQKLIKEKLDEEEAKANNEQKPNSTMETVDSQKKGK